MEDKDTAKTVLSAFGGIFAVGGFLSSNVVWVLTGIVLLQYAQLYSK